MQASIFTSALSHATIRVGQGQKSMGSERMSTYLLTSISLAYFHT